MLFLSAVIQKSATPIYVPAEGKRSRAARRT